MPLHFGVMSRNRCICSLYIACLVAFSSVAPAQDRDLTQIKERELEEVRAQISRLKQSMDRRAADRDRITGELQAAELKIAEIRLALKELEQQRAYSQKKKLELDQRLDLRMAELDTESRQLGAQVRAAYTSGQEERMKLLLNQHDPATLGRLMVYYRYLNEYRGRNIAGVNRAIRDLADLRRQVETEENRLIGLARATSAELNKLSNAQQGRQEMLVALKSKIAYEGSEIDRLAAQEQDLARLIAELTSILADYPIASEEPFSELKGSLTWPVVGTLLHEFGQPRASGNLKWNGVVMAAPRGREIRAIYHGRVIFADWLAGMGLLVIVEHGEGFMTLYGYNETTLKTAGDWVAPGDVIATVGDSGGQSRPALYFEIRQGTRPLSPAAWISRKPSAN